MTQQPTSSPQTPGCRVQGVDHGQLAYCAKQSQQDTADAKTYNGTVLTADCTGSKHPLHHLPELAPALASTVQLDSCCVTPYKSPSPPLKLLLPSLLYVLLLLRMGLFCADPAERSLPEEGRKRGGLWQTLARSTSMWWWSAPACKLSPARAAFDL
jgi:hypothetical protein